MPRTAYIDKRFNRSSREIIDHANTICAEYARQGYDLTLRQLYYQFVSRGLLANNDKNYDRLGSIINDARLAGELDWNYIVDRTRFLRSSSHWTNPASIIRGAANGYQLDRWEGQEYRPEVWIEKDALVGVIAGICTELDVPYFACRGYASQSEMYAAAARFRGHERNNQTPIIIHLGDHDPSGIDMTRDITDRFALFMKKHGFEPVEVRRIALNMDQVRQFNPPPNPAKLTDSRVNDYIEKFGNESWELDALDPRTITALIRAELDTLVDQNAWDDVLAQEESDKRLLNKCSDHWSEVVDFLDNEVA